jgi:hypothetical protein
MDIDNLRSFTTKIPSDTYYKLVDLKVAFDKQGKKVSTKDIVLDALNMYFKSLSNEISDESKK